MKKIKTIRKNYVVTIYSDMEFADKVVSSDSFKSYKKALKFYNENKNKGAFITLDLEKEVENRLIVNECERILDNYKE